MKDKTMHSTSIYYNVKKLIKNNNKSLLKNYTIYKNKERKKLQHVFQ